MRNPLRTMKRRLTPAGGTTPGRGTGTRDPLARVKRTARSAAKSPKGRGPLSRSARRTSPSGRRPQTRRGPLGWLDSLSRGRRPRL